MVNGYDKALSFVNDRLQMMFLFVRTSVTA
jgi:hypothetical protein